MSFNKWILLILPIGLVGCTQLSQSLNSSVPITNILQNKQYINASNILPDSYQSCSNLFDSYMIDNLISTNLFSGIKLKNNWTKLEITNGNENVLTYCHKGKSEGENINYIYCSSWKVSKTTTNNEGVIQPIEKAILTFKVKLENTISNQCSFGQQDSYNYSIFDAVAEVTQ